MRVFDDPVCIRVVNCSGYGGDLAYEPQHFLMVLVPERDEEALILTAFEDTDKGRKSEGGLSALPEIIHGI